MAKLLAEDFARNAEKLRKRFSKDLAAEKLVLQSADASAYKELSESWQHVGNDPALAKEAARLARKPTSFPYRLCTITFAHGYFGLRQAIELDSIRYAIAQNESGGALSAEQGRWAVLALLQAASICAATPGHFAQYLRPSKTNVRRIQRQRLRSPWEIFLDTADSQNAFGAQTWRAKNEVHCADVSTLWSELDRHELDHAVVYADPPYGKDQYSRYYHVLETLVRYDYPSASGMGRYRPNRFTTPFSLKTRVLDAFKSLSAEIAARKWTLVLSYPSNGLLYSVHEQSLDHLLGEYFPHVERALTALTSHSTLGARHGSAKAQVSEIVWRAS